MLDAIIVSDFHLGSAVCQAKAIESFLEKLPKTKRLVLNGDVLESSEHRLSKKHWRVLSLLRTISADLEVVWVAGNHDHDAEALAHIIGARFVRSHEFQSGVSKVLCLHGDQFDHFITDHPTLTMVGDWAHLAMQRLSQRMALYAKRSSKTFMRCCEKVREQAMVVARSGGHDIVCCGHTHHAEHMPEHGYYNSGCWTEQLCHYLTVRESRVSIKIIEGTE